MNRRLTQIIVLILIGFAASFWGCKKEPVDNSDKDYPIQLTASQVDGDVVLEWTKTNISNFESYIILRSTDSIPDAQTPPLLDIKTIDDFETNSYKDGTLVLSEKIFYKVYVKIGDRFLFSPTVAVPISVNLLNLTPSNATFNKELHKVYIYDGATFKVYAYDYDAGVITDTLTINLAADPVMETGNSGQGEELYLATAGQTSLKVFDAQNLDLKTSINVTGGIYAVAPSSDDWLYTITGDWSNNLRIYRRSTGALYTSNVGGSASSPRLKLFPGSNRELAIADFGGLRRKLYNDSGGIIESAEFSFGLSPMTKIEISPDGNFILADFQGNIFDKNMTIIGFLPSVTFAGITASVFSKDGSKIFAFRSSPATMETFSVPGFQLLETTPLSYDVVNAYRDEDRLIVVGRTFTGGSVKSIVDVIDL